jgi:hypothetical protein
MKTLLCFMIATVVFVSCKSKNEEKNRTAANDTTVINIDTFSVADPDLKRVGNLTIDMSDTALIGFLGQPNSKSAAEEWGADGLFHQDWKYPQRGVELNLSSETKDMKKAKVFSITLTEGAPFFPTGKLESAALMKTLTSPIQNGSIGKVRILQRLPWDPCMAE